MDLGASGLDPEAPEQIGRTHGPGCTEGPKAPLDQEKKVLGLLGSVIMFTEGKPLLFSSPQSPVLENGAAMPSREAGGRLRGGWDVGEEPVGEGQDRRHQGPSGIEAK